MDITAQKKTSFRRAAVDEPRIKQRGTHRKIKNPIHPNCRVEHICQIDWVRFRKPIYRIESKLIIETCVIFFRHIGSIRPKASTQRKCLICNFDRVDQ